ncbi:hypothetical protein BCR39DRAFT_200190 [Naematelia encephala]|uniref:Sld7 C-terminal domain-containing protein n=1 Tax=Naematelia encephala TaxID=71784 RepID=A0A1Y2B248_9TREE|nr:hypothetical protein BCR39DRAFT_200190 [Naematelia encephala]
MTTLTWRPPDPSPQKSSSSNPFPNPSPARPTSVNPFARPKIQHEPSSFSRSALLPSLISPAKTREQHVMATPADKVAGTNSTKTNSVSAKGREGWRMLWRGGLELGGQGWRLDGITFFALLSFPATPSAPSQSTPNPFDVPIVSPFAALPESGTDLCLSLESMRGRKYLQVRGVIDLPETEVLDGAQGGDGAVQMAIAPTAPLVAAYFTGLLCREPRLSKHGRTLSAIVIGLGDEDIDSITSTILVYGQKSPDDPMSLRLCVGRKRPAPAPPSERKVRPGEPLPRAPLFFPVKGPKRPPPPFRTRPLSRAPSVNSIYHPPQQAPKAPLTTTNDDSSNLPVAPVTGRTPGRRGEKRPRKHGDDDDERKRKAGRIVISQPAGSAAPEQLSDEQAISAEVPDDDDIFGMRSNSIAQIRLTKSEDTPNEPPSTGRKRPRVPTQVLDNKAAIRKQTLLLMNGRGYAREHELFKDVFGMTTKGTNFALRDRLETGPVSKEEMQRIISAHLDIYLAAASASILQAASDEEMRISGVKDEEKGEGLAVQREEAEQTSSRRPDLSTLKAGNGVLGIVKEEEEEDVLMSVKEEQMEGATEEI